MSGSVVTLLVIAAAIFFFVLWIIEQSVKSANPPIPIPEDPPTDRQLNFIDNLIAEREIEDWMLEHDPATKDEASELIEMLLELPRRNEGV